jgi:lipooligosaccharide transport system ATP-binding protein
MEEAFQLCDNLLIMHKGQNIMEGRPKELMKEHIEKYVLEVFEAEASGQVQDGMLQNMIRVDDTPGVMRYHCDDIDVLKNLATSSLKAGNYHIRQTNLEDVFLRATGRQLNDKQ